MNDIVETKRNIFQPATVMLLSIRCVAHLYAAIQIISTAFTNTKNKITDAFVKTTGGNKDQNKF